MLGRFLKTSSMPLADCFLLLAVGTIPLIVLELVKVVRNARRQRNELNHQQNVFHPGQSPGPPRNGPPA